MNKTSEAKPIAIISGRNLMPFRSHLKMRSLESFKKYLENLI